MHLRCVTPPHHALPRGFKGHRVVSRSVTMVTLICASQSAEVWAQDVPEEPPPPVSEAPEDAERAEREELEQQLEQLRKRVDQLETDRARSSENSVRGDSKKHLSDDQTLLPERSTMQEDQATAPRPGNAVVDSDLRSFGRLPGTTLWFKLGGYAKVDGMFDYSIAGNPNEFITASIPVNEDGRAYGARQFNLHAKQSRVNFDLRSPTKIGAIRVFYENDFFGAATDPQLSYRVRHLYVQLVNVTVGHTWSVFTDPDSVPDTLDFSGPGSRVGVRQAQVRYTYSPVKERLHLALGVEQPRADVGQIPESVTARNVAPDIAVNMRWESPHGHVQASGVGRLLAMETDEAVIHRRMGWGFKVSGDLVPVGRDSLVAEATIGNGVGRYVQDLDDGYGAYVTKDEQLRLIAVVGAYLSYKHYWITNMSSSVTYGYTKIVQNGDLDPNGYHHTHYLQANFVWSPVASLFIGAEQLWGRLVTQNGDLGTTTRSQLSFKFTFSL